MKVFISAGEASGDALGAALIEALRARVPDVEVFGMGGPAMQSAGFEALRDARELNVVGLVEVVRHLPRLFRLLWDLAARGVARGPDVAVMIDAPDFHVRLARYFRRARVPVAYYVGPSVWAWRAGRVAKFRDVVDHMMVLFPFETAVWRAGGVDVSCVGHPLADQIPPADPSARALVPRARTIALLPGSRRSELRRHAPLLLEAGARLLDRGRADRLMLPVAPTLDPAAIAALVDASPARGRVDLVLATDGDARARRAALGAAELALVCSGTATLETALLGTPSVIVYRVSPLSWWIGRRLTRIAHLGLPNLIAGRPVVPELLQDALTVDALVAEAERVLADADTQRRSLLEMRRALGPAGAAARAADVVVALARGRSPARLGLATPDEGEKRA